MIRTTLAAVLALSTLAAPASAQYYGGPGGYGGYGGYDDGYRRPRRNDYDDDEPRPRRRNDFDRPYAAPPQAAPRQAFPGRGGASLTCVTPRGSCQSTPMPVGGGCVCFVPGIGNVPGQVR